MLKWQLLVQQLEETEDNFESEISETSNLKLQSAKVKIFKPQT